MTTQEQVRIFLKEFFVKKNVYQIFFRDDRPTNLDALFILDIRPLDRVKWIDKLKVEDYCEGPLTDKLNNGRDMWVFGMTIKSHEIYIKITMGHDRSPVLCISFHVADYKLIYPFKN